MKTHSTLVLLLTLFLGVNAVHLSPQLRIEQANKSPRSFTQSSKGYVLLHKDGRISTASNASELQNTIKDSTVLSIQLSKTYYPQADSMLQHGNAKAVYTGEGLTRKYSGKGVIIGIIDNGFDYTHPAFQQKDNSLRILRIWNQRDSTGTPPIGFNYGTELASTAEILSTKYDGITSSSHGTHVAGIAAGSIIEGVPYHGVAPEAVLIFVTTTYESNAIIDAVDYIFTHAEAEGKPAIINMSLASASGPHDGTSVEDRAMDQHSSRGIIICSASNSGDKKQHIQFDLTGNDTLKTFTTLPFRNVLLDFWGEQGQIFEIQLTVVDSLFTPLHTLPFFSVTSQEFDTTVEIAGSNLRIQLAADSVSPLNGKSEIAILYSIDKGDLYALNYNVELTIIGSRGTIHGWNGMYSNFHSYEKEGYTDGNSQYTLGDGAATSKSTISIAAFTSKKSFINWNGEEHIESDTSKIGGIAFFSSHGPTIDGRDEPDIATPGHTTVSAENSYNTAIKDYKIAFHIPHNGRDYLYGSYSGTSQAAPVAAGAAALLLEADPSLTWQQVLDIFQKTAKRDEFVQEQYRWGAGKIDIDSAVKYVDAYQAIIKEKQQSVLNFTIMQNGAQISIDGLSGNQAEVMVFTPSGKLIIHKTEQIKNGRVKFNSSNLGMGVYFYKVKTEPDHFIGRIILK